MNTYINQSPYKDPDYKEMVVGIAEGTIIPINNINKFDNGKADYMAKAQIHYNPIF